MRTTTLAAAFGLAAIAVSLFALPASAMDCPKDGTVTAGATDYRPFQIIEDGKVRGADVDILNAIMADLGCTIEFQDLPWSRHLKGIEAGTVDIASSSAKAPEREAFAVWSDIYHDGRSTLFVGPENAGKHPTLRAFFEAGLTLGVIRDYAYGGEFAALQDEFKDQIEIANSLESNLQKVARGRIDGTIGEAYVVGDGINRLALKDSVIMTDTIVSTSPFYVMFSKKSVSPAFLEAFNASLAKLKANGEIDRILKSYL